jgi:hypothetical protein
VTSWELLEHVVLHGEGNQTQRRVLEILALRANRDTLEAHPGAEYIALFARIKNPETVYRALTQLQKSGQIVDTGRRARMPPAIFHAPRSTTVYRLVPEAMRANRSVLTNRELRANKMANMTAQSCLDRAANMTTQSGLDGAKGVDSLTGQRRKPDWPAADNLTGQRPLYEQRKKPRGITESAHARGDAGAPTRVRARTRKTDGEPTGFAEFWARTRARRASRRRARRSRSWHPMRNCSE